MLIISRFDTIMLIFLYLHMFNMNQLMFKLVWLIHVKEEDMIRKIPGNNRIGMKQYHQPIAAGIFVVLHVTHMM